MINCFNEFQRFALSHEKLVISVIILLVILIIVLYLIIKKFRFDVVLSNDGLFAYGGFKKLKLCAYNSNKDKKKKSENNGFVSVPKPKSVLEWMKTIKDIYQKEKYNICDILVFFDKHTDIDRLDIFLAHGSGDAAVTGISNGVIWSFFAGIDHFLRKYINPKDNINIAVDPIYTEKGFEYKIVFSFSSRLGTLFELNNMILTIYGRNEKNINILKGGFN